jgi:chaperonin cofactor prefoldin
MNNSDGVTKDTLERMRFDKLQERVEQLQNAIDSLRPSDEVLRNKYEELIKQMNAEIEELKGRGL